MWNKIKGFIVEEDETAQPAQAPQAGAHAQPMHRAATVGGTPVAFAQHQASGLNQNMVDAIRKQTMGRNTAFTALMGAADQLNDIIADPVVRLKAAQKTAGAGRGAKEFADAVVIHLSDVDGAEMQFSQQLEGKIKNEVGGLQAQAKQAEAQVAAANTEIQALQQRIAQLQQQTVEQTTSLHNLTAEAAAKEAELRQAEVDFKAAAAFVRNELNGFKATILSTLG